MANLGINAFDLEAFAARHVAALDRIILGIVVALRGCYVNKTNTERQHSETRVNVVVSGMRVVLHPGTHTHTAYHIWGACVYK